LETRKWAVTVVVPPGAAGARRLIRAKAQFSPTAAAPLPAGSLSGWSFGNAPGDVPLRFHTSGVAQDAGWDEGSTPLSPLVELSVQSRT
jgi:hypothetical protein